MQIATIRRGTVIDRLYILWSICLVKHYQEHNKSLSPNNIIAEFGDYHWRLFHHALEMADDYKLIDSARMQLTPKGLAACQQWQQISQKIFAL